MPRITEAIVIALVLLLALPAPVAATAIGVNRASIAFTDVLRGGFARESVVITTDSEEPVNAEVILQGDEQRWLNFSSRNFTFSRDRPYTLVVEVRPPIDARIDTYRVNMSVITGELARSGGGKIGTSTRASLGVPVTIGLTGTQRLACLVSAVRLLDTERGQPLELRLSVRNAGNVRVDPAVEIEVFDKLATTAIESRTATFGREILPTVTESTTLFFQFDLQADQYWASIRVPQCDGSEFVTFDTLEPGSIKDDGELIRIDAEPWAEVGDIIPVTAVFRNNGIRALRASFRGRISRVDDDSIVKVIQTDDGIIDPGVPADLETFFNPTAPGQYVAQGRVFYNQKLTIERDTIINVNGSQVPILGLRPSTVAVLVVMAVIAGLLALIIRRKRRLRDWRRGGT